MRITRLTAIAAWAATLLAATGCALLLLLGSSVTRAAPSAASAMPVLPIVLDVAGGEAAAAR